MNNILPTKQQLTDNFNAAVESLRSDSDYIKICTEIRDRLEASSKKADRNPIRIEVPYRLHSLLSIDLTKANLSYSIIMSDFEIRY